jgi:hypothetical protein
LNVKITPLWRILDKLLPVLGFNVRGAFQKKNCEQSLGIDNSTV